MREAEPTVVKNSPRADTAFAFITLFLGYALVRAVLFCEPGVGVTIYAVIFVALAALYMRLHGVRESAASVVPPVIMIVFSAAFIVSGIRWVRYLVVLFEVLVAVYWFLAAFGCRAEERLGDFFPFDMIKAFLLQPFASFFAQPKAVDGALKRTKAGRRVFYIVLGLALATVPAAMITVMLMASDYAFENLMRVLFDSFLTSAWLNAVYFAFGIPVAMYIFGMMTSASTRKCKGFLSPEQCKKVLGVLGFVPAAAIYTALTVILAIYALFFAAQSSYFFSAFSSLLPEGYSFSDYARRGFFELCTVTTINAILVILSELLIKREAAGEAPSKLLGLRALNILMGLSTLLLIAVAGAKLYLYIKNYGLTPARVNAAWFMLLLAIAAVLLIIRQLVPKFNFWRATTVAFVALFAALAFFNTDVLIAKYNIARYYDGSLPSVDVYIFRQLSDAALPELAELLERDEASGGALLEDEPRRWAMQYLSDRIYYAGRFRENSKRFITDRINYLLGYNASRGAALKLLDSGKYLDKTRYDG